ncbi:MAG: ferritin-like domain-containing protein [Methylocystaceae bacterium]
MNLKEALEIAVKDEAKAIKFYKGLAADADDPETRIMLEQIAYEEEGHLKRLGERLKAIKLVG